MFFNLVYSGNYFLVGFYFAFFYFVSFLGISKVGVSGDLGLKVDGGLLGERVIGG